MPVAFVRPMSKPAPTADSDALKPDRSVSQPAARGAGSSPTLAVGARGLSQEPVDQLVSGGRWPRLLRRPPGSDVELGQTRWRALDVATPQALSVTYWFRPEASAGTGSMCTHGRELVVRARRRPEAQQPEEYADPALSAGWDRADEVFRSDTPLASGDPSCWTVRLEGIRPGVWDVRASLALHPFDRPTPDSSPRPRIRSGRTLFAPVARNSAPGVRVGAWPLLVTVGTVAGLAVQRVLAGRAGVPGWTLSLITAVACLVGLLGAKAYYVLTHRGGPRTLVTTGMSVQGFILAALTVLTGLTWIQGLAMGAVLDASGTGLLTGLAIGRLGCLLGGCCVGRTTGSRWGIWSSDRTIGARRIPVQLLESLSAAVLAVTLMVLMLLVPRVSGAGLVTVAGLAGYVAARQVLFPLRAVPRVTRHGRMTTLCLSTATALVSMALLLIRASS